MAEGFYFSVGFGDAPRQLDCNFLEVQGIADEMSTETIAEGGENRFVHALPKPVKHPHLGLKRGVISMQSPLVAWVRDALEGGLAHAVTTRPVRVALLDGDALPLRVWFFEDAFPAKWAIDPVSSSKNEVAIETLELSFKVSRRET